jgi:surface antigen
MSGEVRSAISCLVLLIAGCTSVAPPPADAIDRVPDSVMQYALESTVSGEVVSWRVSDTGLRGTVTPVRTYLAADGYCRDYAVTLSDPGGRGSTWQDTACRDGEGVWRVTSSP